MQAPNPIAFTIAGIDIRWYGILIGIAFLLAIYISYRRAPRFDIVQDDILDLTIFLIPLSIIGARAYYVIFSYDNYRGDFIQMLNIRAGGLAIHGGIQVALAQSIGRWGNFFNSEAHGGPTDLPWAITVYGEKVHPTFLYESIWCLLIFIFLVKISNKRKFDGQIALLYAMLYSFERFWVEGLRTDSLMIGQFRQAQVLSLVVFVIALATYIYQAKKYKKQ